MASRPYPLIVDPVVAVPKAPLDAPAQWALGQEIARRLLGGSTRTPSDIAVDDELRELQSLNGRIR